MNAKQAACLNEEEVRKILGRTIRPDNSLANLGHYIDWQPGEDKVTLDDSFSAEELEAIAWWMRNKS